jgi:hypothetical protein
MMYLALYAVYDDHESHIDFDLAAICCYHLELCGPLLGHG